MAAQVLAGKLAKEGIRNLKLVDLCSASITEAFPEVLRRSHMVLAAVTMNMGLNPVMNAFMDLCHEMDVQNRTISIIGNKELGAEHERQSYAGKGEDLEEMHHPGRTGAYFLRSRR